MIRMMSKHTISLIVRNLYKYYLQTFDRSCFSASFPIYCVITLTESIEHLKINKSVFELPPLHSINSTSYHIEQTFSLRHPKMLFTLQLQLTPKIDNCKPFIGFVYSIEKYFGKRNLKNESRFFALLKFLQIL